MCLLSFYFSGLRIKSDYSNESPSGVLIIFEPIFQTLKNFVHVNFVHSYFKNSSYKLRIW